MDRVRRKLPRAIHKKVEEINLFRQQEKALENELFAVTADIQVLTDKKGYILQTRGITSTAIAIAHKMSLVHKDVSLELTESISNWSTILIASQWDLERKVFEAVSSRQLLERLDDFIKEKEIKREEEKSASKIIKKAKIFCSYSHEDEKLAVELIKRLEPLKRSEGISIWHRGEIKPGSNADDETNTHLASSDLILLLVSPDFIASDNCFREMEQAILLHQRGKALVIPILLRPALWEKTSISILAPLPVNGIPLTQWANRDWAFHKIVVGIAKAIYLLPARHKLAKEIDWDS